MKTLYTALVFIDYAFWTTCALGIVGILFGWAPDLRGPFLFMSMWVAVLILRDGARKAAGKK